MRFKTWFEGQQNADRWLRRKSIKDGKTQKQGMGGGNPRYSGKGGAGHTPRRHDFRAKNKQQGFDQ